MRNFTSTIICVNFFILTALFISFTVANPSHAQEICPLNGKPLKPNTVKNLDSIQNLAVLDNGRVKPLDTYARSVLLQFSGKQTFDRKPAIQWLAKLLFAPNSTQDDKIFLINNPSIAAALGIKEEKARRYSYAELEGSIEKLQKLSEAAEKIDSKKRDIVETELIRVFNNVRHYTLISFSFAFAMPHPDFSIEDKELRHELGMSEDISQFSFIDIALHAVAIQKMMGELDSVPKEQWTEKQKTLVQIVDNLYQWSTLYQNIPLKIIPSYNPEDENWYSGWEALSDGLRDDDSRQELTMLRDLTENYWTGKQVEFDLTAKAFIQAVLPRAQLHNAHIAQTISLELFYNKSQIFLWARILFLFTFFSFLFGLMFKSKKLYLSGWILAITSTSILALGLLMRVVILQRPPVSNLYETFIFVALIGSIVGLLIERVQKEWLGIVITAINGYIFLSIAGKFAMEGDTLQMLVAVLNSNFWLSTHVVSITIGYAGTCVAGIIGHMYLIQTITQPKNKTLLDTTHKILIGALGFALTMTFLGTNLGGIWADQSWGRFWGWDPKENGALLIVIWTAILFHAKIAKIIGPIGLATGSVIGIIVVMWAWFGVNLLSIGLHSYGFTSGLATNLTIYVVVQVIFLLIAVPMANARSKTSYDQRQ